MAQPWNLGPPVVDFSPLSKLGESYNNAYDQARKRQSLAEIGQRLDGSPEGYLKVAQGLLASGDARGAASILALSEKARARGQASDAEASNLIAPGASSEDEAQAAFPPSTPSAPAQRAFNRPVQVAETEADAQRLQAEMEQRNGFGYGNPALPAGMRNNNPGNIKYAGNTAFPGVLGPSRNTDQGDPQSVFNSPEAGMSAAYGLALRKYQGGKRTADELIAGRNGWTPGNSAAAANIARAMGLAPNEDLQLADPQRAQAFLQALIAQEHGAAGARYPAEMIQSAVNGGLGGSQQQGRAQVAQGQIAPTGEPRPVSSLPGDDPVRPADASNTSSTDNGETEEAKKIGESAGKRAGETMAAASSATKQLLRLGQIEALMKNVETGRLQPNRMSLAALGKSLGVNDKFLEAIGLNPKAVGDAQALSAISGRMLADMIGAGGSPANNLSDADRAFLVGPLLSLANDPRGNQILIEVAKRTAQIDIEKAKGWREWKRANPKGSFDDYELEFSDKLGSQDRFADLAKRAEAIGAKAPIAAGEGWHDLGDGIRIRQKQ